MTRVSKSGNICISGQRPTAERNKTMTLEQIIAREKKLRHEDGMFGIKECKKSILWYVEHGDNLFNLLGKYVERANNDMFFNKQMVLACWELINEG